MKIHSLIEQFWVSHPSLSERSGICRCGLTVLYIPLGLFCLFSANFSSGAVLSFQETEEGAYQNGSDTFIRIGSSQSFGSDSSIRIEEGSAPDPDEGAFRVAYQGLIRFDAIFGSSFDTIPFGSTILRASLFLTPTATSGSYGPLVGINLYEVNFDWDEFSSWNSVAGGDGITPGIDTTTATPVASAPVTGASGDHSVVFDVQSILQAWSNGQSLYGFGLLGIPDPNKYPFSSSGSLFASNETITFAGGEPRLDVEFVPIPEPRSSIWIFIAAVGFFLKRSR